MGIFTDDGGPPTTQPEEEEEVEVKKDDGQEEPTGFSTDVDSVRADGEVAHGNITFPSFNVTKNEFYQNMKHGRKRLRFKTGSSTQQYMSKTRYKRPFYISYTDSKNKTYSRKIK